MLDEVKLVPDFLLTLNCFFLKFTGGELSPPDFSFHKYQTSREVEGRGANPDSISPEKYNGGGRDYYYNDT